MTNEGVNTPQDDRLVPMRLQKFLARTGVASRRGSEDLMTAGRVTVNGEVVTQLGSKVDPRCDVVAVDGQVVEWGNKPVTIMFNKPSGVITTMKAQSSKPIVAQYVPVADYPGLYPIGRLDSDTTGLLLFSTDGELGHGLLHPRHHVAKTYIVHIEGALTAHDIDALQTGIMLDDGMTQPAQVEIVDDEHAGNGVSIVRIVIHEGRYHQVKRMFAALGHTVVKLHRDSFGPLELGSLESGTWRLLSDDEVALLHAAIDESQETP